jgi:hypothetical protein
VKDAIARINYLVFTVSFALSLTLQLVLFKYYFVLYAILFFASCWGGVRIPEGRNRIKSIVIGYFCAYVVSAFIGFLYLQVE